MEKPQQGNERFHRNVLKLAKHDVISHDGEGYIKFVRPFTEDDFDTDINFIDYVEIPPRASIGLHEHGDNEEIYFIVSGHGTMTVNEEQIAVSKGDLIVNRRGWTHGLANTSNEILKVLVWETGYSG
jgi:mannose-6-phosphate isomerase-like protein (cupin superfamily)